MAEYVSRTVTPISLSKNFGRGQAWGTGNYLSLRGTPYLVSNEHVVRQAVGCHLGHLPGRPMITFLQQPDTDRSQASRRIPHEVGCRTAKPKREVVDCSRLDLRYRAAPHELLFWLGFPGSTAKRHDPITELNTRRTLFGAPLETPGIPMLTQEVLLAALPIEEFDPDKHVALHYPSRALKNLAGRAADTPNPKGMSGSLLWDSKFVACMSSGKPWTVDEARVCGLIWASPGRPEVAIATKIEYVRTALLHFVRLECAYFHWIGRGQPLWEDEVDWNRRNAAFPV